MEKSKLLIYASILSTISLLSVSPEIKHLALKRAKNRCNDPGRHQGWLEASHFNHSRDDDWRFHNGHPPYNSKEAVRIQCTRHHLIDHLARAGDNGLSKEDNDMAILTMMRRLNIDSLDQL